MKKYVLLLALCLALLSGCGGGRSISGEVVEVHGGGAEGAFTLVVRTEDGEEAGVLMTEETSVLSWVKGFDEKAYQGEPRVGAMLTAKCGRGGQSLTTEAGRALTAYPASEVEITGVLLPEAEVLADGTRVNVWGISSGTAYKLEDGTELLREREPSGPANVYVGGVESFDDLGAAAQERVLAYYKAQGLLYDVREELEQAYADYLGDREAFASHLVTQDISPTASNGRMMYFLTSVTLPLGGRVVYETRLGAAFDRETGEALSNWALFNCPEEEAKGRLLDLAGVDGSTLRAEMEAAFRPEYIVLFPGNLEISFPQGALPSQEGGYMLALDYDGALRELLQPWAVPSQEESAAR